MKYRVGDKVRILPMPEFKNCNGQDLSGRMARDWAGKVMTIRDIDRYAYGGRGAYIMQEDQGGRDGRGWYWYEWMIQDLIQDPAIELSSQDLNDFLST